MTNLELSDIVMCTVDRIVGTVVFVKIDKTNKEGSIIFSEVAPGRIRNIRDYIVPKKKIVCKIIRISQSGHIDLSLRRVKPKEIKELKEKIKQEKSYSSILKTVLENKADETIIKIQKQESLYEFLEEAKQNPKKLEILVGKNNSEKILNILKTQKQKKVIVKKEFKLTTTQANGLELIKKILSEIKQAEIKYLSAGKYTIQTQSDNPKTADNKLTKIIKDIEKNAKKSKVEFSIKEK